jgi:hypothetical protein
MSTANEIPRDMAARLTVQIGFLPPSVCIASQPPSPWPADVRKPLTEEEGRAVVAYVETLLEQLP